jgi:hypothetical protein
VPQFARLVAAPSAKKAAFPQTAAAPPRRAGPQRGPMWHAIQLKAAQSAAPASPAKTQSDTGLPARLRTGIERLSGLAMDDVRVHPNSAEPAKLGALAFTQGSDIHLGPNQEQHLPHEAWHVVQQKQGRVKATAQLRAAIPINDDSALEHEADAMGAKALQATTSETRPAVQLKADGLAKALVEGPAAEIAGTSWPVQFNGLGEALMTDMEGYLEHSGDFVWLVGGTKQGKDLSHVHLFQVDKDAIKGQITVRKSLEKGGPKFASATVSEDDIRAQVLVVWGTDLAGKAERDEIVEGLKQLIDAVIDQWKEKVKSSD